MALDIANTMGLLADTKTRKETAGSTVAVGEWVHRESDGYVDKAWASAVNNPVMGVALNAATVGQTVVVAYGGSIDPDVVMADGAFYYLNEDTNQMTALSTDVASLSYFHVLGYSESTDKFVIEPRDLGFVQ